ncbi:MAG: uroporphyrinogen decarboxylase [Firmicutes bacterium HGW-Firmicutes-7]|nr:MAG: uroporphyrinogen decarboxylase [Firmicutes bacterium HGW-Firmicutes-7]
MTGKERIINTLEHKSTDKLPWVPFAGIHAGALKGYTATEVLQDSSKLFASLMEVHKLYQPDGMPVIFDLQVEAEILGCELAWATDAPPSVKGHPCSEEATIPCRCLLPKETDGRLPMILETMKKMKETVGETTALYGLICGPFTLASHLRGNNLFMDIILNERYVKELMDFCTEVALKMIDLYVGAGMDIIAVVDPLVSQISPDHFTSMCNDSFSTIFNYIHSKGVKSSFFVCGNATRQLEVMCNTKPDSISIDENVNIIEAKKLTDDHNITIGGNIPLTTLMLHGTQQDNMLYVINLLDQISHNNLIIAPGCDMPYAVPFENAIGVQQAIRETETVRGILTNYKASKEVVDVSLPDYDNLLKPFVEVFTLDSATCAACTYMMGAANEMKAYFGNAINVNEYKYTEKINIARCKKMGVTNLPSIYINGKLKWSSLIPSKEEFIKVILDTKLV